MKRLNIDRLKGKLIAVGGGKGGIGKSVISTNLAVALARLGIRTVLVDLDLGCSNIHAILGTRGASSGLADFFNDMRLRLGNVVAETGINGLKLISGAGDTPGISNIAHQQKDRLIRALKEGFPCDAVILDLGPGTNYNVIDFFCVVDIGILVSSPEVTSVTNSFSFVKGVLFRKLQNLFHKTPQVMEILDSLKRVKGKPMINELRGRVRSIDPRFEWAVNRIIGNLRPRLILNRIRRRSEIEIGWSFQSLVRGHLGVETDYLGHVIESDRVRDSVEKMRPFFLEDPSNRPSACLMEVVKSLLKSSF